MSNKKLSADVLQEELDRLRDASRTRIRRLQLTGALIVFLCLLLFLALSLVAANALWDDLHAPVHVAALIGVLAAAVQQALGLAIYRGRFRRRARYQRLWWAVMLLSGAALLLLAG